MCAYIIEKHQQRLDYSVLPYKPSRAEPSRAEPSRAKPSQSVNWGTSTCAKRKSTSPCLLATPAFDRIAGLNNRFLNYKGEYAYANNSEVRLRALTDNTKE